MDQDQEVWCAKIFVMENLSLSILYSQRHIKMKYGWLSQAERSDARAKRVGRERSDSVHFLDVVF